MNKFTLLYTNGCSMTNHQPIPIQSSWTAQLAEILGIPFINDAIGTSSNQRILRTTAEFLATTDHNPKNILAIIQLSSPFRFELLHTELGIDTVDPIHAQAIESTDKNNQQLGWHQYYDMQFINEKGDGFVSAKKFFAERNTTPTHRDMLAYDYWISKKKTYGDVKRHYDLVMQGNAISNLLNSYGVTNNFFVTFGAYNYRYTKHLGGWQSINWLDRTPWDSDILDFFTSPSNCISKKDGHPNHAGNREIAMVMYDKIFQKTVDIPRN